MSRTVVIVGAGAAGLMAGIMASKQGAKTILIEQNNIVGKKMGITGKGRCNITNTCSVDELIKNTPGNGKFLFSAYNEFDNQDMMEMIQEWGLAIKSERGGRVFPQSDSAIEVRNLFAKIYKQNGGMLRLDERVVDIYEQEGKVLAVKTNKAVYKADAVILATGGVSYPVTGSTGDGHKLARKLNHKVTELLAALVPLETQETWCKEVMGLALKNVNLTVFFNDKKRGEAFGEMLFTHFGITGPIVLSLSRIVSKAIANKKKNIHVEIDLKPALSIDALDQRIQRDFEKYKNRQLVNAMKDLLPQKLIPVVIKEAGLTLEQVVNQVSREERLRLGHVLKHLKLSITSTRPIAEAIVTAGGVSTKEVQPKTMESKKVKGLYFAGELLDIDAFTGGYNLQAAFSTGYVAGINAGQEEQNA